MKTRWQRKPLSSFVRQRAEAVLLEDDEEYQRVTVRLKSRGIEPRDRIQGSQVKTKKQYRVRGHDLLVAEIDAKVGGYGIVPPDLDGAVVSGHYFAYEIDETQLDRRFLGFWLKTDDPLSQVQPFVRGALNYAAVRPYDFARIEIPLAPRPEQERIADILEHALRRIAEARQLQESATDESRQFLAELAIRSDLSEAAKTKAGWRRRRLSEVLTEKNEAVRLEDGTEYPTIGVYSFGRGIIRKPPITKESIKSPVLYRVKAGQFLYGRLGGYEGAFAFVPLWADGALVSGEFPTFDCSCDVLPEYLFAYFQSQRVWESMREQCRGLAGRRIRLRESAFLAHELWLPPVSYQQKVKTAFESLESAATLQRDFPAELEALQSSLLDQAFSGNL